MTALSKHMGEYSILSIQLASVRFQKYLPSTSPIRRGSLQVSSGLAIHQVSAHLQLSPLYPRILPVSPHNQRARMAL